MRTLRCSLRRTWLKWIVGLLLFILWHHLMVFRNSTCAGKSEDANSHPPQREESQVSRESKLESLTLEMVSEANGTNHLWPWHDTSQVLQQCKTIDWYRAGPLVNVSVIITFIDNENLSTLLHTVHSVLQRTPSNLLTEVILIGDNSKKDDLGEILDIYIHKVSNKVRLYRSDHMLGLIQARLLGIRMAQGEVVICMDSHVEVQPGWVEPLLYEIKMNPKTLAASTLDWMQKGTDGRWEYKHAGSNWKTYFDWTMVFGFQTISRTAMAARNSSTQAIESPVTIGTVFAIKKSWFTYIGELDSGMELWGGENLDLPIRSWLCGGRVANVPCSRVAHLEYDHNRDYRNNKQKTINRNYKRFGLVWLDSYVKYLYQNFPDLKEEDVGNVSSRFDIKAKCPHNFEWYLKNVFPELGLPEEHSFAHGGVINLGSEKCLNTLSTTRPGIDVCGNDPARAGFYWSKELELRFPIHMFNVQREGDRGKIIHFLTQDEYITKYNDSAAQRTKFIHWQNGPIIEPQKELCLEAVLPNQAVLNNCDITNNNQKWNFNSYSKDYLNMMEENNAKFSHIYRMIKNWQQKFTDKAKNEIHIS